MRARECGGGVCAPRLLRHDGQQMREGCSAALCPLARSSTRPRPWLMCARAPAVARQALQGRRLPPAWGPNPTPASNLWPNSCTSRPQLPAPSSSGNRGHRYVTCPTAHCLPCPKVGADVRPAEWHGFSAGSQEGAPPRRLARHLVCRNQALIRLVYVSRLQRRALPALLRHSHSCGGGAGGSAGREGEGAVTEAHLAAPPQSTHAQ